jgi:H+-transporting ATPase
VYVVVLLAAFQESRANAALALLKRRLTLTSRVRRDGAWVDGPAADLVPGDIVQVSLGDVVPADVLIVDGSLLLDQSMLTGESIPIDMEAGKTAFAGGLVRRGAAIAQVTATGTRTYFGRTAELVSVAHVESAEQKAVLSVVRNLTAINFVILAGLVTYAFAIRVSFEQILLLVLTALLSAVPVALPAIFTLAAALGARTLALKGVLLTRLSSLNEAAMVDVICCDKTGTLTQNELVVTAIRPVKSGCDDSDVLGFAALASSPEGQDPIDSVIRTMAAKGRGRTPLTVTRFTPFDPAVKMAEAIAVDAGREIRVVKGAPAVVATVAPMTPASERELDALNFAGYRTIAVAAGRSDALELMVHRVQRSSARRFGGVAGRVALARRAPGHDHRRCGRHRDDHRARNRAHGARFSAGRHSRERRAEGLRRLRRHFSGSEVSPSRGVPAERAYGRHVRRRRQ